MVSNPDLSAMVEALRNDRRLLEMKLRSLDGLEDVQRMERAVEARVADSRRPTDSPRRRRSWRGRVEEAIRAAMADIVQERSIRETTGHTLNLWAEVPGPADEAVGRRPREAEDPAVRGLRVRQRARRVWGHGQPILGDMIEQASQRIGELGAEAYEEGTLTWAEDGAEDESVGVAGGPVQLLQ